jgi:ABC-2 type transport system ATP-binding protein
VTGSLRHPGPEDRVAVRAEGLSRSFGRAQVLAGVDLSLERDRVHALLGRNGAGKTTLIRLLTGRDRPSSGRAAVFGQDPYENEAVATRTCVVLESQRYPDAFQVRHVLAAAALVQPRWSAGFAAELVGDFGLPPNRQVRKLSRGQQSALGVVVGLAARADLTVFDEPYLGLDAVARRLFYDHLLADFAEHPRTVLLSTHLIDEVADLVEHVVVLEAGRVLVDQDTDVLSDSAATVTGAADAVEVFLAGRRPWHSEQLAGHRRVVVGTGPEDRATARALGLGLEPLSLQELVVRRTTAETRHQDREPVTQGARR